MALGPPVCQHCKVYAKLSDEKGWYCQYCGETDIRGFHPFTQDDEYLKENEKEVKRFYDFWRKENEID